MHLSGENNEEENNIVESNLKEVLNAGLVYSETDDSIILEGDVAPDFGANADERNDPDYVAHTVILIDKKTYLPKQMKFVVKGKMSIEDTKFPYTMNGLVDFDYSDSSPFKHPLFYQEYKQQQNRNN